MGLAGTAIQIKVALSILTKDYFSIWYQNKSSTVNSCQKSSMYIITMCHQNCFVLNIIFHQANVQIHRLDVIDVVQSYSWEALMEIQPKP